MITLHYKVKVRVNLGIFARRDIATIEDRRDVTGVVLTLISAAFPALVKAFVAIYPGEGISPLTLPDPIKLYDDRGVFIELV